MNYIIFLIFRLIRFIVINAIKLFLFLYRYFTSKKIYFVLKQKKKKKFKRHIQRMIRNRRKSNIFFIISQYTSAVLELGKHLMRHAKV